MAKAFAVLNKRKARCVYTAFFMLKNTLRGLFEHGSEKLALAIAFINGSNASSVLCSGRKTFLDLLQLARKWGKPV